MSRRWRVAAGTTLQELDRLLREHAAPDVQIVIRIDRGSDGAAIFTATGFRAGGTWSRGSTSRYLSAAVDGALEILDVPAKSHEDDAA